MFIRGDVSRCPTMTQLEFTNFVATCRDDDRLTVHDVDEDDKSIVLENIRDTNPAALAMAYAEAHDTGLHIGATIVDENADHNGTVTLHR